jgi:predicted transcriptional regulator
MKKKSFTNTGIKMDYDELLSGSRWEIIKELSRGEKSAVELAKKTNQSTANITVQLKLMEAQGFIKKTLPEQKEKRKAGKPKKPYALCQNLATMCIIKPGITERKTIRLKDADDFHALMCTTFFVVPTEHHYSILKYLMDAELLRRAELIALIDSNEREAELFIITEKVHELREKYSNASIETPEGKTKKIISWTHSKQEVEEGLGRKEEYFINLVQKSKVLLDKRELLEELRNKL